MTRDWSEENLTTYFVPRFAMTTFIWCFMCRSQIRYGDKATVLLVSFFLGRRIPVSLPVPKSLFLFVYMYANKKNLSWSVVSFVRNLYPNTENLEHWVTELKWSWVKYVHIAWRGEDRRSPATASGQEVLTEAWYGLQGDGRRHRKIGLWMLFGLFLQK